MSSKVCEAPAPARGSCALITVYKEIKKMWKANTNTNSIYFKTFSYLHSAQYGIPTLCIQISAIYYLIHNYLAVASGYFSIQVSICCFASC